MEMTGCKLMSGSRDSGRQLSFESASREHVGQPIHNMFIIVMAEATPRCWCIICGDDGVGVDDLQSGPWYTSGL